MKILKSVPIRATIIYKNGRFSQSLITSKVILKEGDCWPCIIADLENNLKVHNPDLSCYREALELLEKKEEVSGVQFNDGQIIKNLELAYEEYFESKWTLQLILTTQIKPVYQIELCLSKFTDYFEIIGFLGEGSEIFSDGANAPRE